MAKPDRPTAVLVIAIFHFIIGGLGVISSLCFGILMLILAALFNVAISEMQKKDPQEAKLLEDFIGSFANIPGLIPYLIGSTVISLILAVVLIVAGFGLLKMRGWARTASILYAVVALLMTVGGGLYSIAVINPAVEKANQELLQKIEAHAKAKGRPVPAQQQNPFANNPFINAGSGIFGMAMGSAYPIAVLIVMFLPKVTAAFARAARGKAPPNLRRNGRTTTWTISGGPLRKTGGTDHAAERRFRRPGSRPGPGRGPVAPGPARGRADRGRRLGRERRAHLPRGRRLWEGHRVEDVATPEALPPRPDPGVALLQRPPGNLLDGRGPTPATCALAELERALRRRATSPWSRRTWTACTTPPAAGTCWSCTATWPASAAPAAAPSRTAAGEALPDLPHCRDVRRAAAAGHRLVPRDAAGGRLAEADAAAAELRLLPGGRHQRGRLPGGRADLTWPRPAGGGGDRGQPRAAPPPARQADVSLFGPSGPDAAASCDEAAIRLDCNRRRSTDRERTLLDGKQLAQTMQAEIAAEVGGVRRSRPASGPGLAAVLVGDNPASQVYVRNKRKACEKVGMASWLHELPGDTTQAELLDLIAQLNADPQRPRHPGAAAAAQADRRGRRHPARSSPLKDVDGFGPENLGLLAAGQPRFLPCTPLGVQQLLVRNDIAVDGPARRHRRPQQHRRQAAGPDPDAEGRGRQRDRDRLPQPHAATSPR